jgi:hypothetical protein
MALPPLDAAARLPAGRPPDRRRADGRLADGRGTGGRSPAGLGAVLEALDRAAIPLWTIELTRPAIGVPVVRALSTALCHAKPRFARPRLGAIDARDVERVAVGRERRVPLLV